MLGFWVANCIGSYSFSTQEPVQSWKAHKSLNVFSLSAKKHHKPSVASTIFIQQIFIECLLVARVDTLLQKKMKPAYALWSLQYKGDAHWLNNHTWNVTL